MADFIHTKKKNVFRDLKKKVVLIREEKGNLNREMEIIYFKKLNGNYKAEKYNH